MEIVVCIKQVLDARFPLYVEPDSHAIKQEWQQQVYVVNPSDRCALQEARRIKEQLGQGAITVVTVGPERAEEALYYCLAQGADEAIHLLYEDFDVLDSCRTAFILSKLIGDLNYDLILCGNTSSDSANSQTGASLAELLGLPHVMDVVQIEIGQELKQVSVHRSLGKGMREILECPLPAVLSVDRLINEPPYVSVHSYLLATKRKVVKRGLGTIRLDASALADKGLLIQTTNITLPRPRPKKSLSMDSTLSAEDRMRILMQGGLTESKGVEFLKGAPDEIAAKVVEYLESEGIIHS